MKPSAAVLFRGLIAVAVLLLTAAIFNTNRHPVRQNQTAVPVTKAKRGSQHDVGHMTQGDNLENLQYQSDDKLQTHNHAAVSSNIIREDLSQNGQQKMVDVKDQKRTVPPILIEDAIPPNIHYMWCGERLFEFKHYLSVISVLKYIKPDKIVIHYNFYPQIDKNLYNLWIDDLKHDYQFLILEQMKDDLTDYCKSDRNTQVNMILKLLNQEGGMYISENTWLMDFPAVKRTTDFEDSLEPSSLDGYILLRGGIFTNKKDISDINNSHMVNKNHSRCQPVHQVYNTKSLSYCYIVKGGKFERFWPMEIWELDDPFGRLCRKLFYGREAIVHPKPTYDTLVPNIGHMIWIGGGPMDFVFYLSLLSMLFVAKVDVVYIHGDLPPTGQYWANLQTNKRIRQRIKWIRRTPPSLVYQGVIEPWYRALMSDIIRVDLMIKYGGVYTDTDAIWVKPLSLNERGYEAVACFDWVDWSYPYPDSVNFGISYGKRNAQFWRMFRDTMRILHNDLHGWTGVMNPYRILEKHPESLFIDKRLSVICYYSRCHPIWVKDYHNQTNDHVNSHTIPNWREDVHAFHWTHPNPVEYSNQTILLKSKGIFAEIGQFVLNSAGLL